MLIKISRKLIWILLIIIILLLVLSFLPYQKIRDTMLDSREYNLKSNTVIIDPGHGGVDPGTIGVNGSNEKDINLDIALVLKDILIANGYDVIMTRETDIALHDEKYKKVSRIKTSDLKNRLKIVNENKDAITIMIHQNSFTKEKYHGAQMFYGRNCAESKLLAEALRKSFKEQLQPDNERTIKRSTKDVYVLHNAKTPIVLAECGFLSNYSEAELLSDEEYQQKVAFTIFCGIEEYRETLLEEDLNENEL